jgi:hypothetical protein
VNIGFTQHFAGTPVIVDKFAYTEKRVWRAVAVVVDQRRPNKTKPIYKRKLFVTRIPRAYLVKGMGYVMHPDIYNRLQEKIREQATKSVNDMTRSVFGLGEATKQTTLSMQDFAEALKLIDKSKS